MTVYTTRVARKPDGSHFSCFHTLDVIVGNTIPGMIQCVGPCYGVTADPHHKHKRWLAFVGYGEAARNLAGSFSDIDAAAHAILTA